MQAALFGLWLLGRATLDVAVAFPAPLHREPVSGPNLGYMGRPGESSGTLT